MEYNCDPQTAHRSSVRGRQISYWQIGQAEPYSTIDNGYTIPLPASYFPAFYHVTH